MEGFIRDRPRQRTKATCCEIERFYLRTAGDFLVGLLDNQVVAMGGFKRLSDTSAELKRMRVNKLHQGRGYGTQLLVELERKAIENGIRTLCLETASFRTLAIEFYRKHHYQFDGEGRYGDVRTIRFIKSLDAAADCRLSQVELPMIDVFHLSHQRLESR